MNWKSLIVYVIAMLAFYTLGMSILAAVEVSLLNLTYNTGLWLVNLVIVVILWLMVVAPWLRDRLSK